MKETLGKNKTITYLGGFRLHQEYWLADGGYAGGAAVRYLAALHQSRLTASCYLLDNMVRAVQAYHCPVQTVRQKAA
jgi:hypothetical protein